MRQRSRNCGLAIASRLNRREALRTLGLGLPMALVAELVPRASVAGQTANRAEAASKFLDVKGVKLHYLEWGAGNANPLLLLHPAPLNAHVWDEFGPAMARYYRVVAPDARGFGDSQWSDGYSDDGFVEDVRALVTALGLKRSILGGNSMGGTLAYYYASLYPDDVNRLILVDTGPGEKPAEAGAPAGPNGPRAGGPPPMPTGPFTSPEDAAARVPAVLGPAFVKAMIQHNLKQEAGGQWQWKYDPAVMAAGERSMRDPRKWPRWMAVKCPTLVLRGERSPALPQRIAEQMVAENKNASLVVVPNAGHFIPIEQPAAFETAIRTWLRLQG
jgi:pimeloyl-ACP methyl ester carboxylesterase